MRSIFVDFRLGLVDAEQSMFVFEAKRLVLGYADAALDTLRRRDFREWPAQLIDLLGNDDEPEGRRVFDARRRRDQLCNALESAAPSIVATVVRGLTGQPEL